MHFATREGDMGLQCLGPITQDGWQIEIIETMTIP